MAFLDGNEGDRRASRRRPLTEIPQVTAVKVQSEMVQVVNASREGILIECSLRLTPGTMSQLEILRVNDGPLRVRGRVVRCEITGISGGKVQYRVAIAFNDQLDFISDEPAPEPPIASTVAPAEAAPAVLVDANPVVEEVEVVRVVEEVEIVEIGDDSAFLLNRW